MKNITSLNVISVETYEVIGVPVQIVRTKTNRYYIADQMSGNLLSNGFTSEKLAQDKVSKIEDRRARGNMMGFRFGSKIGPATIEDYAATVWQGLFDLTAIEFDGHYWWTQVVDTQTGKVSEKVRADYVINYLRIPEGLETEATIQRATDLGARWDD